MGIYKTNDQIDQIIEMQKKIAPELIEILIQRYQILRFIHCYQPIGRRNLSTMLKRGERIVRGEVNILKNQGLIEIHSQGMNVTEPGENTLKVLRDFIRRSKGLLDLEKKVAQKLNIRKVFIVPGFYDEEEAVLIEIGRRAADYLKTLLRENVVIGITGGETMAMIAREMPKSQRAFPNITVVPGRGGLGREVEKQANTIAALLAKKLNGMYQLLQIPDNLSKDVVHSLYQNQDIRESIDWIQKIEILVFGIGRADRLAVRRGLGQDKIQELLQQGAVAEAFGYYFNERGESVQEVDTVGVSLEHYKQLKNVIGAATGKEKVEAIFAISKFNQNLVLIIDEGLATEISKKKIDMGI